jgi:hypothetical protein
MTLSRPDIRRIYARSLARFVTALCFFSLNGAGLADVTGKPGDKKKKKTNDTAVIVEVNAASAKFVAGQSVDVELTASVPSLKQVTFIIREAPKHGTLSAIKPHPRDNNKVIVTYTHRDLTELADRFTYACRFGEGPVSAPGIVTLTGERKEAKIDVMTSPRMGKVYLGGETSARVMVKNVGMAEYSSDIKWPAPWSGPPRLTLKVGEEQEFLLTFKPTTIGAFRLDNELQPGIESSKVLAYGECARSLTISPGSLVLAHDKKSGVRTGTLTFANARPDVIKIAIALPPRLKGVTELTLAENARQDIVFSLAPEDVAEFRGELQMVAEGETYRIAVGAGPKPGDLTIVSPTTKEGLDLGRLEMNAEANGKVTVRNAGGLSLTLDAHTAPPFYLDTLGRAFRIEPGQRKDLLITAKGDRYGKLEGELVIEGGDERAVVALSAQVRDDSAPEMTKPASPPPAPKSSGPPASTNTNTPKNPPATSTGFKGRSAAATMVAAYLSSNGIPIPKEMINPYLDRVERVEMTEQTSSSVTLAWPKPKVMPVGWRIDVGAYIFDPASEMTVKVWSPLNNWKLVDLDSDRVGVRIHALKPASQFEIRIMGVDRDGKFSQPSPVCLISTAAAWRMPSWVWRTLFVLGLLLILYVLYRYRRGDFEF